MVSVVVSAVWYNYRMAEITVYVRLSADCVCGAHLEVSAELEVAITSLEYFRNLHQDCGHGNPHD